MTLKKTVRAAVAVSLLSVSFTVAADDVLVLDSSGRAQTKSFRVLDHEGEALGLMVAADDKFTGTASTAAIELNASFLAAEIVCPVPKGMKVSKANRNAWAGDGAELFVRPVLSRSEYYQYSANAAGVFSARKCSSPDVAVNGWKSKAIVDVTETKDGFKVVFKVPVREIFKKPLEAGDVFGINFTRSGKTCGGLSTWAAVGASFSNIEAFGRVVYGGGKAYFKRRISAARAKAAAISVSSDSQKALNAEMDSIENDIMKRAEDPGAFALLESRLSDIAKSIVSAAYGGKKILMFDARRAWGDSFEPDGGERQIEAIRIKAARNSRAVHMFAVANLSETAFLGQFKVNENKTDRKSYSPLSGRLSISRGIPVPNRAGRMLYDPVAPLLLKSVLRLAPGESAPIYLELDTRGMDAGAYRGELALKKTGPGFEDVKVPIEVEIVDADLNEVAVDRAGYDYVGNTFAKGDGAHNVVKYLVDRGYNIIYISTSRMVPHEKKDGSFSIRDFSPLDRHLDAVYSTGIPRGKVKLWIYMGLENNHPWNAPMNAKGQRTKPGDGVWEKGIQAMVRLISDRVRNRYGIGKDRIYWYPVDEPSGPIEDPTFKSNIARAYHAAKIIKKESPRNLTMTDPLPVFLTSGEIEKAMPRLAEVYDVMELYRPYMNGKIKETVAKQSFKEIWTYSISTKDTTPVRYRRDTWENLRDGYREISTFWHMTSCAGSNFDPTDFTYAGRLDDYASLYVDFGKDEVMPSRRQIAADMGYEEARLILWLRNRFKGSSERLAEVEAIVREAADTGTMAAMDSARDKLLSMVEQDR